MARLTRSRRTAAKAEASEAVPEPETAPPPEKRTRRGRKQEVKPVEEPVAPSPPPSKVEEEPKVIEEKQPEKPAQEEVSPAVAKAPVATAADVEPQKKIEVEEEKLDFEVEDELQLKAQKDADIDEDTDEASKDQVSPAAAEACEEKLSALDEMLKKRVSRRQSSAVDKENRKDRWGKLAEKAPINDSRAQAVVTTDSLKELSAELEKEQTRKKSTEESVPKDQSQMVTSVKAAEEASNKTEEAKEKDDLNKRNQEDELNQRRRARHVSMGDDNSTRPSSTDVAPKPNIDSKKTLTAGIALGTTNWDDLENNRRKPRNEATPPKEQPSIYLLVNNLVRPFTLSQLTDFISHGNERVVTDLWLDKIKSKAIVTFETSEMSELARQELHNLVWPKGSPKTIKCEFLTAEQVDETKNPSEQKPPNNAERAEKDASVESKEESSRHRDRNENGSGKSEGDDLRRTLDNHKDKDRLTEDRHQRHNRQERESESSTTKKIREWDLPKLQMQQKRQKEESTPKEEPPKKDVDDSPCLETFFKKTVAMPPLYWLPLNNEQAIEKAKAREAKQKRRGSAKAQTVAKESPLLEGHRLYRTLRLFDLLTGNSWKTQTVEFFQRETC